MALCWLAAQSALSPCSARLPGEIEQAWPTGQQMPLSSSVELAHRRSKIAAVWNRFEREDATLRTVPQITTFTAVVDSPLSVRLNWDVPQPCVDSQGVACTGFELLVQDLEYTLGGYFLPNISFDANSLLLTNENAKSLDADVFHGAAALPVLELRADVSWQRGVFLEFDWKYNHGL